MLILDVPEILKNLERSKPKPTCDFCSATEDLVRCVWPAFQFLPGVYGELEVGDRVKRRHEKRMERPPARIAALRVLPVKPGWAEFIEVDLLIGKKIKSISVRTDSPVLVERPSTCFALCCPNHRAERSERHAVCRNHWMAWELVA